MAFFECELDRTIQFLMLGGNAFSTTVNIGFSGHESRNKNWLKARKKWKVSYGFKPEAEYDSLRNLLLVVAGRADGFRLYDWTDHSALGQPLGTVSTPNNPSIPALGDGTTAAFQLIKVYTVGGMGGRSYVREVTKPITSSVLTFDGGTCENTVTIYKNGSPQTMGSDVTLDYTSGIATFASPPALGVVLTADYEFHIPVRFDVDEENTQVDPSPKDERVFSWPAMTVIELRPPNY